MMHWNTAGRIVFVCMLTSTFLLGGCFKKGDGKGSRKTKPKSVAPGDVFVPGPGNKPGVVTKPEFMNETARKILAACFNIPEEEVQDVVGWNNAATAIDAANALCDRLAAVNFNGGTVNATAAQSDVQ